MPELSRPIYLATRGSALALAQANTVLGLCQAAFPAWSFELKIIKTTGDKLQTAPPDLPGMAGTKGLFTKELEVALLHRDADLAVHSLKDLPTDLPDGLELAAVLPRVDVRDVLIYRDGETRLAPPAATAARGLPAGATLRDFPPGATIATSSTRRQAQVLALRPDLKTSPIRGNVGTRLRKLLERPELDGLILAAAGLQRLGFQVTAESRLTPPPAQANEPQPSLAGLRATHLAIDEMLPCVGQAAIGIEARAGDGTLAPLFEQLNHSPTLACVRAERAFLHGMGGGCLSPVAAYADLTGVQLRLRAVSFRDERVRRGERFGRAEDAAALGATLARELRGETG